MKLYFAPAACSLAVHIAARELGLDLQYEKVDVFTHRLGDGSSFYAINPRGYVPVLELDGGSRMTEVTAILQYLSDQRPEAGLLPAPGGAARYEVLQWLGFIATELHKGLSPWLWHAGTAESTKQSVLQRLAVRLRDLEASLSARPFLSGDHFTIADAYAFAILNWSRLLEISLSPYPAVGAYLARVGARPAVREALAFEGLAAPATI